MSLRYKRPIGIGVYGHTSHDVSSYLLEASYSDEDDTEGDFFARDSSFVDVEESQIEEREDHSESGRSQYSDLKHSREVDGVDLGEGEVYALISCTNFHPGLSVL